MKPLPKWVAVLGLLFTAAVLLTAPAMQESLGTLLGQNVAAKLIAGAVLVVSYCKGLPDKDQNGIPDVFERDAGRPPVG